MSTSRHCFPALSLYIETFFQHIFKNSRTYAIINMDAATSAVNKLLYGNSGKEAEATQPPASNTEAPEPSDSVASSGAGQKDTTVEREVAPAVEHETVKKEHETKEQTVIDRERHQHHYHTTVQPLKDQEIEATKHDHEQAATQERVINKDSEGDQIKARVDARENAFNDKTVEAATKETTTDEGEVVGEQVHHHLHETVQPVIEKGKLVQSHRFVHWTRTIPCAFTEPSDDSRSHRISSSSRNGGVATPLHEVIIVILDER